MLGNDPKSKSLKVTFPTEDGKLNIATCYVEVEKEGEEWKVDLVGASSG